MFIVNWDILKLCSQWIRMMGLNCFRGLLCAGCNSREPLFTGGKKFCIPCTVRISTEVNEIFAWVRINTCNQSKLFSEKQAHYWRACWLCSCIFCHLDLKSYPILVGLLTYVRLLMVTLQQLHTTAFLTRSVYVKRKSRRSLTGFSDKFWLIQKMLSWPHFISCCFLLRAWWLYKIHNVPANLSRQGSKLLSSEDFREFFSLWAPELSQP